MADLINLRQRRKQKAREAAEAEAVANRAQFGRRKSEREHAAAEKSRVRAELEGKKLDK